MTGNLHATDQISIFFDKKLLVFISRWPRKTKSQQYLLWAQSTCLDLKSQDKQCSELSAPKSRCYNKQYECILFAGVDRALHSNAIWCFIIEEINIFSKLENSEPNQRIRFMKICRTKFYVIFKLRKIFSLLKWFRFFRTPVYLHIFEFDNAQFSTDEHRNFLFLTLTVIQKIQKNGSFFFSYRKNENLI